MFKRKIYEIYKSLNLTQGDVAAELSMLYDYLNISEIKVITDGLTDEEEKKILEIAKKRIESGMPLQQIVGFGYFMNEKFKVNSSTLIPRPETEILVRECAKLINKNSKVLDIGTGTGCIAIEIAKLTGTKVDAVDISEDALKIAKINAKLHNVEKLCSFFKSDIFSCVNQKYDFIISNPPYIPISQKNTVSSAVMNFEPHAALFAKDELGLEYYEKIIDKIDTFLNKNGYLGFELGVNQYKKVAEILEIRGFTDIKIYKDLDGIERALITKYF